MFKSKLSSNNLLQIILFVLLVLSIFYFSLLFNEVQKINSGWDRLKLKGPEYSMSVEYYKDCKRKRLYFYASKKCLEQTKDVLRQLYPPEVTKKVMIDIMAFKVEAGKKLKEI